jgi:hypothetical protein
MAGNPPTDRGSTLDTDGSIPMESADFANASARLWNSSHDVVTRARR